MTGLFLFLSLLSLLVQILISFTQASSVHIVLFHLLTPLVDRFPFTYCIIKSIWIIFFKSFHCWTKDVIMVLKIIQKQNCFLQYQTYDTMINEFSGWHFFPTLLFCWKTEQVGSTTVLKLCLSLEVLLVMTLLYGLPSNYAIHCCDKIGWNSF